MNVIECDWQQQTFFHSHLHPNNCIDEEQHNNEKRNIRKSLKQTMTTQSVTTKSLSQLYYSQEM